MDQRRFQEVAALFEAARGLSQDECASLLEGADPEVRAEVEELLGHHAREGFLGPAEGVAGSLPPGTPLGAYRIERWIGSGGMGSVYLGERDGERYALKVLHPHLQAGPAFRDRFRREAEIGIRVVHENVVRTYDVASSDGSEFLVMEYVEGQTLDDLQSELKFVPERLCLHIAGEVAKGLAAIHDAGAVHRDIKPGNVLITPDHTVKVMDLGIAHVADEAARLSLTGAFIGSVAYAAPEQFLDEGGPIDGRADLYALGVVLYEIAAGAHPYVRGDVGRTIRAVIKSEPRRLGERNPQVSPFFEEFVHALMAKEAAARFPSAAELVAVVADAERSDWWQVRSRTLGGASRSLRRVRVPRDTSVYGRGEELARLSALFDSARAADGRVLLLEGEAGIGKTRLVDEFVDRLRADGEEIHFLFGSYPPAGAGTASEAFTAAYRDHWGAANLDEALAAYLPETPALAEAFSAYLRGDGGPHLDRETLPSVLVQATRALAAERPAIVLIDDLHFAGEEGRALFAALALAAPGHRLLLVGTMRPGLPQRWRAGLDRLDHVTVMSLSRLGPKDLARLLVDAFRSERLASELSLKIAHKSDGNPFFAFEIIRGLKEGQFLKQKPDGTWLSTQAIEEIVIPSSIVDLVRARVADLDDADQELLEVAACCGFEFDPVQLAEALGIERIPLLRRLGRIEKSHHVIHAAGPRYVFDHHQVQEVLYEGLSQPLREEYHAALAETLEKNPPGARDGAFAAELCRHFLKGGKAERARPYLRPALDHLAARARSEDAVRIALAALAAPGVLEGRERCELLLRSAARLAILGRRDEQASACAEARALADETNDPALRARAYVAHSEYLREVSESEPALRVAEESVALAREAADPAAEFDAMGSLALALSKLGEHARAIAIHGDRIAVARRRKDRRGEAAALSSQAGVLAQCGDLGTAVERHRRALALQEEDKDLVAMAGSLVNLAIVTAALGRHDEARGYGERGLHLAMETGHRLLQANACMNLGNIAKDLGRYEEALEWQERARALCVELGSRDGEAGTTINLGGIHQALGEWEEARRCLERGRAICSEIGHRHFEANAISSLGGMAERDGRDEDARGLYEEALALYREMSLLPGVAGALMQLGQMEKRLGRLDAAARRFEEALEVGRTMPAPLIILGATAHRAVLPGGDVEAALRALEEHGAHARRPALTQVRHLLWQATGDAAHLKAARALLLKQHDAAPEANRAAFLENEPLHREILADWDRYVGESTAPPT